MVIIDVLYEGGLHCRLTHGPSGKQISTDAPKDNKGKGETFSPTDLVASALGSCMLTIMAIYAMRHDIALEGTKVRVEKEMQQVPDRRITKLSLHFQIARGIDISQRKALEQAALSCPVHKALTGVEMPIKFTYPD